ncbi:hypothetical protein D3C72_2359510 [compost metagenome]
MRSEYVRYTSVLRLRSTARTTCRALNRIDMRSEKTLSCCRIGPLKAIVATCRQAIDASGGSSAMPSEPLMPPVRARDT